MNDYSTYDAVQLAADTSFIAWVLTPDASSKAFWEKWMDEHPGKKATVKEARQIVEQLQFKQEELDDEKVDRLWQKIDAETDTDEKSKVIPLFPNWVYAAAAAILLAVSFFFLLPKSSSTFQTGQAEWLSHVLPDSSSVYLNASTQIDYSGNWQEQRLVKLDGEAFFEVKEGEKFTVETESGNVQVLGTSFNVFARMDKLNVTCFTGKVKVSGRNGQSVILNSGQTARFHRGKMRTFNTGEKDQPDWQKGVFTYSSTPLTEVFAEIERQFGVTIDASEVNPDLLYNGFFNRESLDSALYYVTFPTNLEATRNDQLITIKPKK